MDYLTPNAFTKKKEPFAQISDKKPSGDYENLLANLSVEEEPVTHGPSENKITDPEARNKILEEKLSKSLLKIERL